MLGLAGLYIKPMKSSIFAVWFVPVGALEHFLQTMEHVVISCPWHLSSPERNFSLSPAFQLWHRRRWFAHVWMIDLRRAFPRFESSQVWHHVPQFEKVFPRSQSSKCILEDWNSWPRWWATAGAVVATPAGTSKTDGARGEEDADGATRWGFWILHVGFWSSIQKPWF